MIYTQYVLNLASIKTKLSSVPYKFRWYYPSIGQLRLLFPKNMHGGRRAIIPHTHTPLPDDSRLSFPARSGASAARMLNVLACLHTLYRANHACSTFRCKYNSWYTTLQPDVGGGVHARARALTICTHRYANVPMHCCCTAAAAVVCRRCTLSDVDDLFCSERERERGRSGGLGYRRAALPPRNGVGSPFWRAAAMLTRRRHGDAEWDVLIELQGENLYWFSDK